MTLPRFSDAHALFEVIEAAEAGLLKDKRIEMDAQLSDRDEVLP